MKLILDLLPLLVVSVILLGGCDRNSEVVSRGDTCTVARCYDGSCENLFVYKSDRDKFERWYGYGATCEVVRDKDIPIQIISKGHPDYDYYKLKYEACRRGVKNFNDFYFWYEQNKDLTFEYVVSDTTFQSSAPTDCEVVLDNSTYTHTPVYESKTRLTPRLVGRVMTYTETPYKAFSGFRVIKQEGTLNIPQGATSYRHTVTRKVDAMTYYVEKLQK